MKHNLKISSALLLSVSAALLLSACGTRHLSRDISPQGVAGEVIFPDPAHIVMKGGTFPNLGDLRLVGPGMTKDQLYQLLGRPHFHEGYAGVREWDYLFHFRKDGKIITCQYKVVYDEDYLAQTFHWAPASCAALLAEAAPPAATEAKERTFNLSADALFQFAKYGADDILPRGREELAAIASQLKEADSASIRIVGHTDRIGGDAANQALSQRRAQTVREFLVDQGVAASGITAEGRGESEPVKDCEEQPRAALIACLTPNRRVEIQVAASSAR
jgi:OmpA-OmpF porin, OOP family